MEIPNPSRAARVNLRLGARVSRVLAEGTDFEAVMDSFSGYSITLMIIGGVFYTVGTIFYSLDNLKYNHVIWHFFVLAGSIFHFFMISSII